MTATAPLPDLIDPADRRRAAPWFIGEGVALLLLAGLAIALPAIAGLAGALVFGWVLIMVGIMGFVGFLGARGHAHSFWAALSGLVAVVVGALILWHPFLGAIALAIFIAAYLLIDAVALIGMGLDQRKRGAKGWAWLVVSGAIDLVLAAVILAMGPLSDAVLLGWVIALDLFVAGVALITLGWAARKA
jgi:uncharacterized membrane protein HdeD (DUF308 family)